jgi:hypothetical protein
MRRNNLNAKIRLNASIGFTIASGILMDMVISLSQYN